MSNTTTITVPADLAQTLIALGLVPSAKAAAPKVTQPKADLKPLSKGEIKRLRQQGASWVRGLADWQLQGRRPANAVATGRVVSKAVLAQHGYCRPTGALKAAIKAA